MMARQLRLPRGHLSWSQLSLWEHDPTEYALRYIMHQAQRINSGMVFGKHVAQGLEAPIPPEDIADLLYLLPSYDTREKRLEAAWKSIQLIGYADTFRRRDHAFREYKTGRRDMNGKPPWTRDKAQAHGQIAFYGFMLWITDRKLPPPAFLDWIETKEKDGIVSITGRVESFEVQITIPMILEMGARIEKAANEISMQYVKYLGICQQRNQLRSSQNSRRRSAPLSRKVASSRPDTNSQSRKASM